MSDKIYRDDALEAILSEPPKARYPSYYADKIMKLKPADKPSGLYECFHCGQQSVIWDSDFSFEDYCEEGEGIIHECH